MTKRTKIVSSCLALLTVIFVYIAGCESLLPYHSHQEVFIWASISCVLCIVSAACAIICLAKHNGCSEPPNDALLAASVIAGALAVLFVSLMVGQLLRVPGDFTELPRPLPWMTTSFYWLQFALVGAYIVCVFCRPKGVWATQAKLSRDPASKEALEQMVKKLKTEEFDLLHLKLTPPASVDHFAAFRDKLFRAIDYASKRHDWYEDQRSRIFQIILGISALALTIAGFFLKNLPHFAPLYCSIAGLFLIILVALIAAVFHYNKELDADRPYRSISDIRFWFFRYNLPSQSSAGKDSRDIRSRAEAVARERRHFFERTAESFDLHASLREDLEQLFILQLLQRYKHESLKALRWLLSYSLLVLPFQLSLCGWAMWMAGPVCPLVPS